MISQSCNGLFYIPAKGTVHLLLAGFTFSILLPADSPIFFLNRLGIKPLSVPLAYDPTMSPFYQVVCVQTYKSSCNVQIYSSETQIWRNARNNDFGSFSTKFLHGVFWKGGIQLIDTYDGNFSRFDIEQETLQAMPRPPLPKVRNSNNFRHFMECEGHFFFIDFDFPEYIIYEMETLFKMDCEASPRYKFDCQRISRHD
ncbi:hypothetical protein DITRI_Ditri12bG0129300 [Diplodiscus trichospermus]